MMFKLGKCAEKNWRNLRGFDYLAKVIEGVQFSDGIEVIPEIRIAARFLTQTPLLTITRFKAYRYICCNLEWIFIQTNHT